MTSEQKSRVEQANTLLKTLRDELKTQASTNPDDGKQKAFVDNQKHLETAIKEVDAIKATGG